MSISKQAFTQYIKAFNFRELFNEMGWNNDKSKQPIVVDGQTYQIAGVAEKSGFKILVCEPGPDGLIPHYNLRKKIQVKVTKLFQENLIIFVDATKVNQRWQYELRQSGKPSRPVEVEYNTKQDTERIYQRASGLLFSIDEEDNITIIDVTQRVAENFQKNADEVTRQFYKQFEKEHDGFLKFIEGINDRVSKEWYASLMLNRLMFCYFIQRKGFLNKQRNYLSEKLEECKKKKGKNNFYNFYRSFLLKLFHDGLGKPDRSKKMEVDFGQIPYLNGGLFDVHELERGNNDINIDDKAFESIFNFFDKWEWHLDTRPEASTKEINPDVIGYIFEKYINDRTQMGAYYTKEDITEYISKNCILPWIIDETQRNYSKAFAPGSEIWKNLKSSGDTYIYPALKYGINPGDIWGDLPKDIKAGLNVEQRNLLDKRRVWNTLASEEVALPTELWREVIERKKRYEEVKTKIESGSINHINDFITYNLNIREFVQDIIKNTTDHDFIRHFYKALTKVTILDPTCGSGAFLFAALNILEPIYAACIIRMQGFIQEEDYANGADKAVFKHKYKFFRETLEDIQSPQHPNLSYFIYKSIILRNLYGVDIMKEAVEIAKLRLFLKLVATVEPNFNKPGMGLEPLPDIDFNIRSGNTLIGFANEYQLDVALTYTLDGQMAKPAINESMEKVAMAYEHYKKIQLSFGDNYESFKKAKNELDKRLKNLNHELNTYLAKQYGIIDLKKEIEIEVEDGKKKRKLKVNQYQNWIKKYLPFHWFAEFYEILNNKGGFDLIIGNPPYVEYSKVRDDYNIPDHYKTLKCGNLYPFIIEQSLRILNKNGNQGLIIPLSGFCTQRMEPLLQLYKYRKNINYISHYGWRPATLFEGVNIPLSIIISISNQNKNTHEEYTTEYYKWYREKRSSLFNLLEYTLYENLELHPFVIPKIGPSYIPIFKKLFERKNSIRSRVDIQSKHILYYRNTGGLYWRIITDFKPFFELNGHKTESSTLNTISFIDSESLSIAIALLNSNLFWLFYVSYSSFHHVNPIDLLTFPVEFNKMSQRLTKELINASKSLMSSLKENSTIETRIHKGGNNSKAQTFYPSKSKNLVDNIDLILSRHYNFSHEELDLIINYDIKYRLKNETDND